MGTGMLMGLAGGAMVAGVAAGRRRPGWWLAAVLAGAVAGLLAAVRVLGGGGDWEWRGGVRLGGELVRLELDALGAWFLVLLCVIGGAGAVYGASYWNDRAHPRSAGAGRRWWCVLLASLGWILATRNGLHFLLGWELFTVASYFLVTLDRQRGEVRATGWLYLAASHVAVLALFGLFGLLAARTGGWELGPWRERAELAPLFWLALAGFGIKAGVFPLHVWLPSAHASAPSHVSALLSGVTIKIGVYGLLRFSGWLPVPAGGGWAVAALGVASAVLGVAFALGQHDLKRLLAYHSVENIGIILIGLGFAMVAAADGGAGWGRLALAGALLHVWNHGLFKALLFFGAGSVLHATGTREMSLLGGLWRRMPWTCGLFALGAAAIAGLPPLNGFVSEWLVYLGLFDAALSHGGAAWAAMPAAIALGMTGALALACFVKVCGIVFLGAPRSEAAAGAHECGRPMRIAMGLLAACCVAIGLAPVLCWPALARACAAWHPGWGVAPAPTPLVKLGAAHVLLAVVAGVAALWLWRWKVRPVLARAVTWDCGYHAPAARMQYTAGSFAGILVEWFAWILRPVRHERRPFGPLPSGASVSQHTPETVLDHVIAPAARAVRRVSDAVRRLQQGRVQSYLLYLVLGLAALVALVLAAGHG